MKTLVIIEDCKVEQILLSKALNFDSNDVSVIYFSYATEALVLLKEKKVDLIITDLFMNPMSGLEFLEILNRRHPELTTIVRSNLDKGDAKEKAIANSDHYFDKEDNENMIKKVLECLD